MLPQFTSPHDDTTLDFLHDIPCEHHQATTVFSAWSLWCRLTQRPTKKLPPGVALALHDCPWDENMSTVVTTAQYRPPTPGDHDDVTRLIQCCTLHNMYAHAQLCQREHGMAYLFHDTTLTTPIEHLMTILGATVLPHDDADKVRELCTYSEDILRETATHIPNVTLDALVEAVSSHPTVTSLPPTLYLDDAALSLRYSIPDSMLADFHYHVPTGYWRSVKELYAQGMELQECYDTLRQDYGGWHPDDRPQPFGKRGLFR